MDTESFSYYPSYRELLLALGGVLLTLFWIIMLLNTEYSTVFKVFMSIQFITGYIHFFREIRNNFGGRIIFSAEGIEHRHPLSMFNWSLPYGSIQMAWWDGRSSVFGDKIVLELGDGDFKEFFIRKWRQNGEEAKQPITEFNFYQAMLRHVGLKYVSYPQEIVQKRHQLRMSADLGVPARNVTIAFATSVVLAFVFALAFPDWHLVSAVDYYDAGFLAAVAVMCAVFYMHKNKTSPALIFFLAVLCCVPFFFAFYTLLHSSVVFLGSEQSYEYQLRSESENQQEWVRTDGEKGVLHFKERKFSWAFQDIGAKQWLVTREMLGRRAMHTEELRKIYRLPSE